MAARVNNQILQKAIVTVTAAAVIGAWGFLRTRASAQDVEANRNAIKEHVRDSEKRLRSVENNILVMCEFLDRQDKEEGGPGIHCRKQE